MKKRLLLFLSGMALLTSAQAQSQLYPQHYDLKEVKLLDGPFKTAMDINIDVLMQYDTDRLLTPFVRQAGLSDKPGKYSGWTEKHPSFHNWGLSNWTLEGHVGGHYLSALALAYAACHDEAKQAKLKERLDYMLAILKDCQDAFASDTKGMKCFIGGQPINKAWIGLYNKDLGEFSKVGGWVPFYCQHKVLAGLRDAYIYTDGATAELAKELFRGLSDWSVNVVSNLTDDEMQRVLGWEHGGMNETLADAYKVFGDAKYLEAAKRYSHRRMIDNMQNGYSKTFLDNQHANTQVPKYIGFERIYQVDPSVNNYRDAAHNFWEDVATRRTVCIGGNSVDEHFLSVSNSNKYIDRADGPESCNTNNMLKLSETLFDETHDAKYADFYEAAMWNHILSTQDPRTGGYVYFTPLRPQSYKVYSQVNQGMWCCVGTGMENHSKYAHFIYTHTTSPAEPATKAKGKKAKAVVAPDTVFVNLFTASELTTEKYAIRQDTKFPYEQKTKITVTRPGNFVLAIRKPQWTDGQPASFTYYAQEWKAGDVVEVNLPMKLTYEECPNYSDYIAFKYGPILLGARTTAESTETMRGEYAGEGRMDHSPALMTDVKSLITMPMLIGNRADVLSRVKPANISDLTFTVDASRPDAPNYQWSSLTLEPYYRIHHSRHNTYWYQQTPEGYSNSTWAKAEQAAQALNARTIDGVATGEQQSEAGHDYAYSAGSSKGNFRDEYYRDTEPGGYIQYSLALASLPADKKELKAAAANVSLMCRFITSDKGRKAKVYLDNTLVGEIQVPEKTDSADASGFFNVEWPVPAEVLMLKKNKAKDRITFRIEASEGTMCPGLYYVRLLRK